MLSSNYAGPHGILSRLRRAETAFLTNSWSFYPRTDLSRATTKGGKGVTHLFIKRGDSQPPVSLCCSEWARWLTHPALRKRGEMTLCCHLVLEDTYAFILYILLCFVFLLLLLFWTLPPPPPNTQASSSTIDFFFFFWIKIFTGKQFWFLVCD